MNQKQIKTYLASIEGAKSVGTESVRALLKGVLKDYMCMNAHFHPSSVEIGDILLVDIGPCKHYAIVIHTNAIACVVLPITKDPTLPYTRPFESRILKVFDESEKEMQLYIHMLPIAVRADMAISKFVGVSDLSMDTINEMFVDSNDVITDMYNKIQNKIYDLLAP